MKKILATACIAAIMIYFGNQFAATRIQAEAQTEPEAQQNFQEVYGKIKQANGNEIIVAIGIPPSANRGGTDFANTADEPASQPSGELPSGGQSSGGQPSGEPPSGGQPSDGQPSDGQPSDGHPSGEPSSGGQPSGGQPSGERTAGGQSSGGRMASEQPSGQAQGERPSAPEGSENTGRGMNTAARGGTAMSATSIALTGEEQTFLIPVTAKITTGSGDTERTLRFTQLAYKNTVKLTLNENGNVTAVNILS